MERGRDLDAWRHRRGKKQEGDRLMALFLELKFWGVKLPKRRAQAGLLKAWEACFEGLPACDQKELRAMLLESAALWIKLCLESPSYRQSFLGFLTLSPEAHSDKMARELYTEILPALFFLHEGLEAAAPPSVWLAAGLDRSYQEALGSLAVDPLRQLPEDLAAFMCLAREAVPASLGQPGPPLQNSHRD